MSRDGDDRRPVVPVGGGVPVDPVTGKRYGYLPRKAASRKLVIRAPLGMPWLVGSLAAGALIAIVGLAFLLLRSNAPGAPYVDQGPLQRYAEGDVTPLLDGSGWLDRRNGLRAIGGVVAYCPTDGGWLDEEGQRYDAQGRSSSGSPGLPVWRVRAVGGRVYVDPTGGPRVSGTAGALAACPNPREIGEPAEPDGL